MGKQGGSQSLQRKLGREVKVTTVTRLSIADRPKRRVRPQGLSGETGTTGAGHEGIGE